MLALLLKLVSIQMRYFSLPDNWFDPLPQLVGYAPDGGKRFLLGIVLANWGLLSPGIVKMIAGQEGFEIAS
jgi:hypothetical protein